MFNEWTCSLSRNELIDRLVLWPLDAKISVFEKKMLHISYVIEFQTFVLVLCQIFSCFKYFHECQSHYLSQLCDTIHRAFVCAIHLSILNAKILLLYIEQFFCDFALFFSISMCCHMGILCIHCKNIHIGSKEQL